MTEQMHPDFPDVNWTVADAEASDREGWNIYEAHGGLEIERNDTSDVEGAPHFESDDAAVESVFECAASGSERHARAMVIHAKYMHEITQEL